MGNGRTMKPDQPSSTQVRKRSLVIAGHATSVSLEDAFWDGLKEMAQARHSSLAELVREIDSASQGGNLSSTLRLAVLAHYRQGRES